MNVREKRLVRAPTRDQTLCLSQDIKIHTNRGNPKSLIPESGPLNSLPLAFHLCSVDIEGSIEREKNNYQLFTYVKHLECQGFHMYLFQ